MSSELESNANAQAGVMGLLRRQFIRPTPIPEGISLDGQVAIITGSNSGLGFEASRQLLQLNLSHLIMGVRSQTRGEEAAAKLKAEFPTATISIWLLDMESYKSVREFAERCKTLSRIDIVILNAGFVPSEHKMAAGTGHERTLQVNYLGTALLTLLLVPILREKHHPSSPRSPVISLSGSDTAYDAQINASGDYFAQLDDTKGFNSMKWYQRSKLFLILFVQKASELIEPSDVLLNVTNPGLTRGTELGGKQSGMTKAMFAVIGSMIGRSVAVGASCYLNSVLVQGSNSHGSFTSDWTIMPYPRIVYTKAGGKMKEQLWKDTITELESLAPEALKKWL